MKQTHSVLPLVGDHLFQSKASIPTIRFLLSHLPFPSEVNSARFHTYSPTLHSKTFLLFIYYGLFIIYLPIFVIVTMDVFTCRYPLGIHETHALGFSSYSYCRCHVYVLLHLSCLLCMIVLPSYRM